jgi:endonuclease YncB( thermonuclease family)
MVESQRPYLIYSKNRTDMSVEAAPQSERLDEDAGLLVVERGVAWHFKRYADEQSASDRQAYAAAEKAAQAARRGLCSDPQPVPPWEWQRR